MRATKAASRKANSLPLPRVNKSERRVSPLSGVAVTQVSHKRKHARRNHTNVGCSPSTGSFLFRKTSHRRNLFKWIEKTKTKSNHPPRKANAAAPRFFRKMPHYRPLPLPGPLHNTYTHPHPHPRTYPPRTNFTFQMLLNSTFKHTAATTSPSEAQPVMRTLQVLQITQKSAQNSSPAPGNLTDY